VGHSATVFFTGGAYSFTSIAAGPEAALLFDAPAQVRVSGRFATDPDSTIGSSPEGKVPASEIVFYVAGINGSTGALGAEPAAARMGPRNQVAANFYVPNGTLQLQQGTQAEGAFVGRDVEAGPHATLALDSAFFNRPPVAVDDSATVAVGGTVTLLDSGAASVLANDSDPENATLSAALVTGPSHGTLVLNADGTFAYSHDGSESFSDSFVYEACDEGQPVLCDTASVSFTIFVPTKRVTIVKVGSGGGYVSSVPAGIDCGPTCSATFLATETVFLDAVPDAGSVFGSWGGDAECADGVIDGPGDVTCIAPFDLPGQVTLTVQRAGTGTGFVSSDPAGISCGLDCSASFPRLTRIDLFAAADTGSFFVGWSGDPDCEDGFVSADVAKTCVATFDLSPPPPTSFTLTIVTQGTGQGTVTSNPFGIVCGADCVRSFPDGTLVTLFAREDSDAVFAGWGGDCSGLTFSTSVTLDADKTCTATFNLAF
jgi:hypothetical protein